jgi:hypothetical protein
MLLVNLEVRGLRHAREWRRELLGPVVELPVGPEAVAIGDALLLAAATLDGRRFSAESSSLGLPPAAEVALDGMLLDRASWTSPVDVAPMLASEAEPHVIVALGVSLDSPLYASLREHAHRDPRLAAGMAEGPLLQIKVGWLFSRDSTALTATVHQLRVGDTDLVVNGPEHPIWLHGFLRDLGGRIARPAWGDSAAAVAARLQQAALSPDSGLRRRFRAMSELFAGPPFGWGALEVVRTSDQVPPEIRFGPDLLPLRHVGPDALSRVVLAEAACLRAPDVLVVEAPLEPALRAWLAARTEGDDATLEQLFLATPA